MDRLFTYKDVNVYTRQVEYIQPRQWLDDVCINLTFRFFEDYLPDSEKFIYMVDPAVVSFIKLQIDEKEEFEELWTSQNLADYEWIFFPLSDSATLESMNTGTHWSLLVFHNPSFSFYHFDSADAYNQPACTTFIEKISKYLNNRAPSLVNIDVPRQENGFDCGVYTILFAEQAARFLLKRSYSLQNIATSFALSVADITAPHCYEFRQRILDKILQMAQQSNDK